MAFPPWLGFLVALALVIWLSQRDLGVALFAGGALFGILAGVNLWLALGLVFTSWNYAFLALAVALIPLIGGVMEESGMMVELVEKLDVPKRAAMMLSPALFGLLPMPGGALLSAPMVDKVDPNLDPNRKVAINVWHRHLLILVYPAQSSLIIASYLAGIPLYSAVAVLLVPFTVMLLVGYFTLITAVEKRVKDITGGEDEGECEGGGESEGESGPKLGGGARTVVGESGGGSGRDLRVVLRDLFPIVLAPVLDLVGRNVLHLAVPEAMLFVGLFLSLYIALRVSHLPAGRLKPIAKKMKVWRYPLLIYAMFFFLEVFKASGVPELIGDLYLHLLVFLLVGFILGFATGRVQLPASIMLPIFVAQHALAAMSLLDFALVYTAIFLGYIFTPVHPCVAYSIEYFEGADYRHSFKYLARPSFACFAVLLAFAALFA
ncbi:MAG: DUF401 family protein [Promethearchaeota archaeon]